MPLLGHAVATEQDAKVLRDGRPANLPSPVRAAVEPSAVQNVRELLGQFVRSNSPYVA
jgi:hypothetical protein